MSYREIDIPQRNETRSQLLVIVGVPAVGKDFILRKAMACNPELANRVRIFDFGDMLFQDLKIRHNLKTKDEIAKVLTQEQITEAVSELVKKLRLSEPSILNTHLVNKQQNSLHINIDIIEKLDVRGFIYVWAEPQEIFARRKKDLSRMRYLESVDDISLHQDVEQAVTEVFSHRFGSFMRNIDNETNNVEHNIQILLERLEIIQK